MGPWRLNLKTSCMKAIKNGEIAAIRETSSMLFGDEGGKDLQPVRIGRTVTRGELFGH